MTLLERAHSIYQTNSGINVDLPNGFFVHVVFFFFFRIVSNVSDPSVDSAQGVFVQEFVRDPLLVGGHKFDVGIYAVVTSIQPLRIYVFNGERGIYADCG